MYPDLGAHVINRAAAPHLRKNHSPASRHRFGTLWHPKIIICHRYDITCHRYDIDRTSIDIDTTSIVIAKTSIDIDRTSIVIDVTSIKTAPEHLKHVRQLPLHPVIAGRKANRRPVRRHGRHRGAPEALEAPGRQALSSWGQ
jgi:hypothetical protein